LATAIELNSAKNVTIKNCMISGFDIGVSSKNSSATFDNTTFHNNRIAIDLQNSNTTIINSSFVDNQIDILINNAPLTVINSILHTIINQVETMPAHIQTNPFKVSAQAKVALKTSDEQSKRKGFKNVLKTILEYAGIVASFYSLLETVMKALAGGAGG
jgi:hypothetical protein